VSQEDRTVVTTITRVLGVLVVIAVIFYFLADMVTSDLGDSEEANERMQAKIEENISPVGKVNIGSVPAASGAAAAPAAAAAGPRSGAQVYNATCMACHSTGVAGAPKVGDKAAWGPRAAKGIDGLLASATHGLNAMPPRGTCADCSDDELKGAIEHMLSQTGL